MNSENPIAVPDAGNRPALSAHDRRSNKRLALSLETEHCGSTVVLHCQGRPIFRNRVGALPEMVAEVLPVAQRMVVDLAGVEALDSASLGKMVLMQMWADAAGYILKFANPSAPVRRLFETTNLVSVFNLYANIPKALAAISEQDLRPA